jgi:DNA/RNA-binding domain of Phe-tRNA-synthetase-like protein
VDHYRRFKKTYHGLLQLESVASSSRQLPLSASLVTAMFSAELESQLLTAGHDLGRIRMPLVADVTRPGEHYLVIGGRDTAVKADDMCIRDDLGILSTVVYGPDDRSRLSAITQAAIFTTYAPVGITDSALEQHLVELERLVRADQPSAITEAVGIKRA